MTDLHNGILVEDPCASLHSEQHQGPDVNSLTLLQSFEIKLKKKRLFKKKKLHSEVFGLNLEV